MYYFITSSKDATVYLQQPDQNTGLDEILEVSKVYYGNIKDVSRTLLQFDVEQISQSLASEETGSMRLDEVTLMLRESETEEVPLDFTLYAYPISQSWEMGIGTRFDDIETAGVTWSHREGDSATYLISGSSWLPSGTFETNTAGSTDGKGGVWYTDVSGSQKFSYETRDVQMDVKNIVLDWISGSKENNGMIIKYPLSKENDTNDYGILKFFGKETNTIHQPKIRIGWDDSNFETGSLEGLSDDSIAVSFTNFKKNYKVNTKPRIRVKGRELYPPKSFSSTFEYSFFNYLPETTYYQIRDYHTDDIIVPFSEYTKVSCDEDGNFFDLNLSNWEIQRIYKIEIKVVRNGIEEYFDEDYTFRVTED